MMYEILDEATTFSSGESKRVFLEAQILEVVMEEPDPVVRLQTLLVMLTLCHRTLSEADLRKYIALLQVDLGTYWFEASNIFSLGARFDLVRVEDKMEGSLVRALPDLDDEEDQLSYATKILEEACLMHTVL